MRPNPLLGGRSGSDQPQRDRRRTQAPPGPGGRNRTPPVKGIGEPCAGEPHARFDGRGLETERHGVTAPAPDPTNPLFLHLNEYLPAPRSPSTNVLTNHTLRNII